MVVLITGANKGIGFAVAKLFQSKGYKEKREVFTPLFFFFISRYSEAIL